MPRRIGVHIYIYHIYVFKQGLAVFQVSFTVAEMAQCYIEGAEDYFHNGMNYIKCLAILLFWLGFTCIVRCIFSLSLPLSPSIYLSFSLSRSCSLFLSLSLSLSLMQLFGLAPTPLSGEYFLFLYT